MKITPSRRRFAVLDVSEAEKRFLARLLSDTMYLLGEEPSEPEAPAADPHDPPASAGGKEESAADPVAEDQLGTPSAAELEKLFGTSAGERPTDPALLRLLPDVDGDDAERSTEFRRLTENDIRQTKLGHLRTALFTLGAASPISLDRAATHAWAVALTDIRLVIATRLEIVTDDDFDKLYNAVDDLDGHTQTMLSVYDFLTWAQEQFASILTADLADTAVPAHAEDE